MNGVRFIVMIVTAGISATCWARRWSFSSGGCTFMFFYWVCGSSNITVENCTLGWCGGSAIGADDGFVTNFNIINNEIGFCGNYGLDARWAGPVLVSNNYIHDCGLITWQAPGVRVNTNAAVTQNSLFNFHASAIADDYSAILIAVRRFAAAHLAGTE
jgi:hypothetical protein